MMDNSSTKKSMNMCSDYWKFNGYASYSYPENRPQEKMYLPSKNNVERQNELHVLITRHNFRVASGEREVERRIKVSLSVLREQERDKGIKKLFAHFHGPCFFLMV